MSLLTSLFSTTSTPAPALPDAADRYVIELRELEAFHAGQKAAGAPRFMRRRVTAQAKECAAILSAFRAGFEPCTPPSTWYRGTVGKPTNKDGVWTDSFPGKRPLRQAHGGHVTDDFKREYVGGIPPEIIPQWKVAKTIFGNDGIRVYSPHSTDLAPQVFWDPIMIGRLFHAGGQVYFEIGRWDLEKDLAHAFEDGQS